MKVLAFDIWADYGHFRKFYTTTSPLSFSFPPPSTVIGMLGSLAGLKKSNNEYLTVHRDTKIAIRILNPVKKVRLGLNLLETKGKNLKLPMSDKNPRTQIRTEFLKDPRFRIFVNTNDILNFQTLINHVKSHEPVFTVSMGLSELLANFEYVGLFEAEEINNTTKAEIVEISTPVTGRKILPDGLLIEEGKIYFKEKLPIKMNDKRIIEIYDDVIFEPNGKTLKTRVTEYCRLENGENIIFF